MIGATDLEASLAEVYYWTRAALPLNEAATFVVDTDVLGVTLPGYDHAGDVRITLENHGLENGCNVDKFGIEASTLVAGVVVRVFFPYESIKGIFRHKTREVRKFRNYLDSAVTPVREEPREMVH